MANFNLNKVILGGRLVADPELKQTQSGVSVASMRMAVNRYAIGGQQPETDFFNLTAWRQTAEFICRNFHKGSSICVIGSIQNRSWTDSNGEKRYATDIVVEEAKFVDSRDESPAVDNTSAPAQNVAQTPKFEEIKTDDDFPF